jgi:hypothetical protein
MFANRFRAENFHSFLRLTQNHLIAKQYSFSGTVKQQEVGNECSSVTLGGRLQLLETQPQVDF